MKLRHVLVCLILGHKWKTDGVPNYSPLNVWTCDRCGAGWNYFGIYRTPENSAKDPKV